MFRTGLESILYLFVMSLGEYKSIFEEFNLIVYSSIAKVLFQLKMTLFKNVNFDQNLA